MRGLVQMGSTNTGGYWLCPKCNTYVLRSTHTCNSMANESFTESPVKYTYTVDNTAYMLEQILDRLDKILVLLKYE
jgi:hypothetical protein